MSRLLKALLLVLGVLLVYAAFVRERWTTPVDELRVTLGYYNRLDMLEREYFARRAAYGSFDDLVKSERGRGRFRMKSECQEGYCFTVSTSGDKYAIGIVPQRPSKDVRWRALSLYADETRVIRVSYGSKLVSADSAALSKQELDRFWPR